MERRFDLLTRQIKTNFWATVWPYVRTDRVFGNRGRDMKIHFCPQNFAIWGTDRKFGTWPSSRARSTYYYYTTPGRTCQVFFRTKIKNPRLLHLGCRGIEGMVFTAVTASHFVGRVLVGIVTSGTASAFIMADVIVIGVPHCGEVVAFIHGVFQGTLARDGTVAVVWTVPAIHGAMDVSHYCSPPIIISMNSAKAQTASISAFSP
jgi:hypothetical protein